MRTYAMYRGVRRSMKRIVSTMAIWVFPVLLVACATDRNLVEAQRVDISRTIIDEPYRIGVDDGLQINVWRNPELSVSVPVRPDGMISVPLIGDVRAGGLAPEQASKA